MTGRAGAVLVVAVCVAGVLAAGQEALAEKFHMHALAGVGTEMFAVGRGRTVEIRSWASPEQTLRNLAGAGARVSSAAASPDGAFVAAGDAEGGLTVWEVATGKLVFRKSGHRFTVWTVAFSPDGKLLASGAFDGTVRIWDTATWVEVGLFVEPKLLDGEYRDRAHMSWVRSVSFSPDSRTLATSGCDGYVRIWDVETLRLRQDALRAGINVYSVVFSPDGTRLACSTNPGAIVVYRTDTWEEEMRLETEPLRSVYSIAFSPEGTRIFSGGFSRRLQVWDLARRALVAEYSGPSESIWGIAVFPDGQRVITTAGEYATDYIGETWLWRIER